MFDRIPQREVPFDSNELQYLNSFQCNLHHFALRMRSSRIEDMADRIDRTREHLGISPDRLVAAMMNGHEAVCTDNPSRADAVHFLAPMLANDEAFSGDVYDYMRLIYAVGLAMQSRAINKLGMIEASDPQPEDCEEKLAETLKGLGHGGWEAQRMVERLNAAVDEHSKLYLVNGRDR